MTFEKFLISPRVQLLSVLAPRNSATVHILLDSEATSTETGAVTFAKKIYGDLRPKILYPGAEGGLEWVMVLPSNPSRPLTRSTQQGLTHKATSLGSALATVLSQSGLSDGKVPVGLVFSPLLTESLRGVEHAFLQGLLTRSTSNKLPGGSAAKKEVPQLSVHLPEDVFPQQSVQRGQIIGEGVNLARGLVNLPANILNPESFAEFVAEDVRKLSAASRTSASLSCDVFDYDMLKNEGAGLICAVGKGSSVKPRIVRLRYEPQTQSAQKHVTLVGKGITFDTGGLDIKGPAPMRNMKKDMGGSASAYSTFRTIVRLGVPVKLTCYLALAENMIAGDCMRPGDVYQAKNGFTVEIDNTDAEGRLVLADALCYAVEEKPDWLIDLATLTGAARVALGPLVDPFFTNTPELEKIIMDAALQTGDWVWPLPLVDDYEQLLDSNVADMANSSASPLAGAITAALFLRKFTGELPWTHIDTYMWAEKAQDITPESGANGKCVRLVTSAIESFIKS